MKTIIGILVFLSSVVLAQSAWATTNLIYPITGNDFHTDQALSQTNLFYSDGSVSNSYGAPLTIGAGMGQGNGAVTSFSVRVYNNAGNTPSCNVVVRSAANGSITSGNTASTSAAGFQVFTVSSPSNVPTGSYTYSLECTLPGNTATSLLGVTPQPEATLLYPVAGDAFQAQDQAIQDNIQYDNGIVFSNWTTTTFVGASLGHGTGGSQSFYINGYSYHGTAMTCSIYLKDVTGHNDQTYSGTTTTVGYFHLPISTTPPAGHYTYTVGCGLPGASNGPSVFLTGATPQNMNSNLYLPIAGSAFRGSLIGDQLHLEYSYGSVFPDPSGSALAEASLGHNVGGTVNFTVTGSVNPSDPDGFVSCSVLVNNQVTGGSNYSYSNEATAAGFFSYKIPVTPPSGNYTYSILCDMSTGSSVNSVTPDR